MKNVRRKGHAKVDGREREHAFKNVFHEPRILAPAIIASCEEARASKAIFDGLVLAEVLGVNPELVF